MTDDKVSADNPEAPPPWVAILTDAFTRTANSLGEVAAGMAGVRLDIRLAEERRQAEAHRGRLAFAFGALALVMLIVLALGNRTVATAIRDCTEVGHPCSDRQAAQAALFTRAIIDADGNNAADTEEIKAKLEGRSAVTLPPPPALVTPRPVRHVYWTWMAAVALGGLVVGFAGHVAYTAFVVRRWDGHERRNGDDRRGSDG